MDEEEFHGKAWIVALLICMFGSLLILMTPGYALTWHSTENSITTDEAPPYITDIEMANDTNYSTDAYHTCGGTPCDSLQILENYSYNEHWEDAETINITLQFSTNSTSGNTLAYAWNYTDSSYDYIGGYGNAGSQTYYQVFDLEDDFIETGEDLKFRISIGSGLNSDTSYFESTLYWYGYPYFTNCSDDGTVYVNFYGVDENTQEAVDFNFEIYIEMTESNASFDMSGQNNYSICIDPSNETYTVDAIVRYSATGYAERYYYLDSATLSPTNESIILYLLNKSDADLITMAILNELNLPESDIVVRAQKQDIGLGTYIQVAEARSDFEGFAYANMELGENYKFYLTQDGVVLREYEEMQLQTDALTFYVSSVEIPEYFSYYDQVATSCDYDNSTKNLTCNYVDTSGLSMTMIFNVSRMGQAGRINQCNDTSSSSSGTFICQLTDNATYQYSMYGCYPNDCGFTWQSGWIGLGDIGVDFGITGLFLALLIVCFCSFTAYYDTRLALISTAFGFIFCGITNLIQFGAEGIGIMFSVAIITGIVAIKVRT